MGINSPLASENEVECYKLDVNLLSMAHEMTHSQGDGRISVADITKLISQDISSPDKVETLLYLYKNI